MILYPVYHILTRDGGRGFVDTECNKNGGGNEV
jgi:hypothetical protein